MKRIILPFLFFIVSGFLLLQVNCTGDKKVSGENSYASLDSNVTYVGMETCKGCHPDIYNTFIRTGMGQSIDLASKKKSSADFSKHPGIYDRYKDFYYKPLWSGDTLVFLEYRLVGRDTVYKREQPVTYIIGSGQHTNSHLYNINGYIHQAPMTFYTQSGKWDLPPGFENGNNTRFERKIGLECLSCHNGYPQITPGSENKYSLVPRGIDCERCHGPGSRHVEEKKNGRIVDITTAIDYSIVNPAKLPIDLQLDVCQRCHIQGNAVLNDGKSFYDFHPGMHLSDVMNVYMPVYEGSEDEHIMASHAERMKQSKCYISTTAKIAADPSLSSTLKPYKNALTCITCHDPHVSRLETPYDNFNKSCRNCHTSKTVQCNESLEKRKIVSDNCVKCHMPENGTLDIPHVRVHDHKIKIPVSKTYVDKVRKFAGIVAVNNPSPPALSRAEAFLNYYEKFSMGEVMLDSAAKYINSSSRQQSLKSFALQVRLLFLRKDFNSVISFVNSNPAVADKLNRRSFGNEDAWSNYYIGVAFKNAGGPGLSLKYFKKCFELAPLDPDFANEYAEVLAATGAMSEAQRILTDITELNPDYAPASSNLGYIYMVYNQDLQKAELYIGRALQSDPDYISGLFNKAQLYLLRRDKKDAISVLKKIVRLEPSNQKALMALKQLENQPL